MNKLLCMPKQLSVQQKSLKFIPEIGKRNEKRRKQTTLTIHFTLIILPLSVP